MEAQVNEAAATPQSIYRFYTFCHPRACDFLQRLDDKGLIGLLRRDPQDPVQAPKAANAGFFVARYEPEAVVDLSTEHLPNPGVEFHEISPYGEDNQNIFFYCVARAAAALTAAGKFDDAEWFWRAIFDPMDGSNDQEPERYWKYEPFRVAPAQSLSDFLALLNGNDDAAARADAAIEYRQENPFDPWGIARYRPLSLMKTAVRSFIENVLARANQGFATANDQEQLLRASAEYIRDSNSLGESRERFNPPRCLKSRRTFALSACSRPRFLMALCCLKSWRMPSHHYRALRRQERTGSHSQCRLSLLFVYLPIQPSTCSANRRRRS